MALLAPFLLMAVSIIVLIAALKTKRLQAYWLSVDSILAIVISPSNLIGLPIGVWALVVLSQGEVRAAFAANIARQERRPRRSWLYKLAVSAVFVILLVVIVRTFFAEAFIVPGDSHRGSAAWQPRSRLEGRKTFVPHDLIVYHFDGQKNLGRVVRNEGAD